MSKTHNLPASFKYAFSGLATAVRDEPNFRIHLVIGSVAIFSAGLLKFSPLEWLMLAVTIFIVLILELLNTVLESIVDIASPEIREKAKVAKDVSAGAVLLGAIFSIIVGFILFLPKLLLLLK